MTKGQSIIFKIFLKFGGLQHNKDKNMIIAVSNIQLILNVNHKTEFLGRTLMCF